MGIAGGAALEQVGLWHALTRRAIVHEADEGAYRAEILAIPGRATQGDTILSNLYEAVGACLSMDIDEP